MVKLCCAGTGGVRVAISTGKETLEYGAATCPRSLSGGSSASRGRVAARRRKIHADVGARKLERGKVSRKL